MCRHLLLCSLLFIIAQTQAQTLSPITYAGSGLVPLSSGAWAEDIFAGNPSLDGFTHSTVNSYPVIYLSSSGAVVTNPVEFDGTSVQLYAHTYWDQNGSGNTYAVNDSYDIGYTFQVGYAYAIRISYYLYGPGYGNGIGMGISLGAPQLSDNILELGQSVIDQFGPYPSHFVIADYFLKNPVYTNVWSTPAISGVPQSLVIPYTPSSTITGINIESLPTAAGSDGSEYIAIQNVSIAKMPIISGTSPVCSSQTFSINSTWPVGWDLTTGYIANIYPNGTSATVVPIASGAADLRANLTGPDGNSYPSQIPVQIGAVDASTLPIGIVPQTESLPPNSPAQFILDGANYWSVTGGTITGGQGTYNVYVQTDNNPGGYLYVTAYVQNACGLGAGVTNVYPIISGSSPGVNYRVPAATDSAAGFNNDSLAGNAVLFPNPATNSVEVILPKTDFTKTYIKLYDISGHLLRMIVPTGPSTLVDISHWARGTYIVSVYDGRQLKTSKLIKQ